MAKFKYNIHRDKNIIEHGTISGRGFEHAYYNIVEGRRDLKGSDEIELYSSKNNYWTFKISNWGMVDDFEYVGNKLVIKKDK